MEVIRRVTGKLFQGARIGQRKVQQKEEVPKNDKIYIFTNNKKKELCRQLF